MTAKKKHPAKVKAKRCSHKLVSITWHPETGQDREQAFADLIRASADNNTTDGEN